MYLFFRRLIQTDARAVGLLVVLGFCVYSFMLEAPFKTMDDTVSIVSNPLIRDFSNLPEIFTSSFFGGRAYYRPLVSVSFMLEHALFGFQPYYYNLTNLFLHLLSGIVVFHLMKRMGLGRSRSFFVGLIFLIHPLQWEAVSNIPGRSILLSAFFALCAFNLFLIAKDRGSRGAFFASVALFAASLLSKESGAMLPVVLGAFLVFWRKEGIVPSLKRLVPFLLVIAVYLVFRSTLDLTQMYVWPDLKSHVLGVFSFAASLIVALRLLVAPYDLRFDRSMEVFTSFTDPYLGLTALFWILAGVLFWRNRRSRMLFFPVWALIELFPVSQIVTSIGVQPGYISAAEHFLYLPLVGMAALVVAGVERVCPARKSGARKRFVLYAICATVLVSFSTISARMATHARSEESQYLRTLFFEPHNARIRNAYGFYLAERGLTAAAKDQFKKAVVFDPTDVRARISLAKALCDLDECLQAVKIYEGVPDAGALQGVLDDNLRRTREWVIRRYRERLFEEPTNARLWYSLGVMLVKTGELETARRYFLTAAALRPNFREAVYNIEQLNRVLPPSDFEVRHVTPGSEDLPPGLE